MNFIHLGLIICWFFFYKKMLLRISTVKTYNIDNCLTSKKINKMKLLMITLMDTVKVIIVNI